MGDDSQDLAKDGREKLIKRLINEQEVLDTFQNDQKRIISPYERPSTTKLIPFLNYNIAKDRQTHVINLHKHLHSKGNRRMRQVEDPYKTVTKQKSTSPVHTVVDIYPEFYSVIEGRPLRCSGNIKVYLNDIRNYAMLKQQIGYRRDMAMQLGKSLKDEQMKYEKICIEYKTHVENFQQFIKEDHLSVMKKIHEAEKVRTALNAKNLEYFPLLSEIVALKDRILELEEMRQTAKIYRKFIYSISPLSWRNIYDENYRRTKIVFDFALEREAEAKEINLDFIIRESKMELKNHRNAPRMYFIHPTQLIAYFENLVLQCRKYLIHVLSLSSPVDKILSIRRSYKESLKAEEDALRYYVEYAEIAVNRMNESSNFMQKMFWFLMYKSYFPSFATPDVLKLHLCIEYVFIQVFGQGKFIKTHAVMPMKMIEELYDEINLKLDLMNVKIVKESQEECFREDLQLMKAAYDAARKLRSFEVLEKALRTAYLPPAKFCRPVLNKLKKRKPKAKKKPALEATNLTNIQRESLELLTTWCYSDDPEPYLENLQNAHFNLSH